MTPTLTRDQVRRIDELAASQYGLPSLLLMENAGRSAAAAIDKAYGPRGAAFVLCGPGNNGGDGCVIARCLHNAGWTIRLLMTASTDRLTPDASTNFRIIEAMGVQCSVALDQPTQKAALRTIAPQDIVIDALLGTGFKGVVRSPLHELIRLANAAPKRGMVAIDVPSGLDCDTGIPGGEAIRADLTITFVALKRGFTATHAAPYLGRVEVADIGAPRELVAAVTGFSEPRA